MRKLGTVFKALGLVATAFSSIAIVPGDMLRRSAAPLRLSHLQLYRDIVTAQIPLLG